MVPKSHKFVISKPVSQCQSNPNPQFSEQSGNYIQEPMDYEDYYGQDSSAELEGKS